MSRKGLIMPDLYIVATPIGNLEDITLRALRVLREVSLIAAEDTRKTIRLLTKYDIKTPMTSYYEHSKLTKIDFILSRLSQGDVALVSEAGTPGINDPGYELIQEAIKRGIKVIPIPGPSAVVNALVISGLPTDSFTYLGFLPNKSGLRKKLLETVINQPATLVTLEAPHRVKASLNDILSVLGDRRIAVCRELTKIHEEVYRGTVRQAIEHFATPKGEFTLVIEGKHEKPAPKMTYDIEKRLLTLHNNGISVKEASAILATETGLSRKELYQKWLELKKSPI
jgi:16S rRNA (cytidine1402-2'-O)-methyltransferase